MQSMTYDAFLAGKQVAATRYGFDASEPLNPSLFPWQAEVVRWALRRGRAAMFLDCGLGKTLLQLEWARYVVAHTGGQVLILAPLAVAAQTVREGAKFGIAVHHAREASEAAAPGIYVTNYDRLDRFPVEDFAGVVLDESSILKGLYGKTRQVLTDRCGGIQFRLCCTATPAPNDHVEIGSHAEFLGTMTRGEMLMRWFIQDTGSTAEWRLKGHAVDDFWRWVGTWAVAARKPSDLGYEDDGFDLLTLDVVHERVSVDITEDRGENLFREPTLSASTLHQEMRRTAPERAARVAALVNGAPEEPWIIWCNTNYEADALRAVLPQAVEVRGSEAAEAKERKLVDFSEGRTRVMITKPEIGGFGLNWQHCARVAFVGLSYSFEQFYQAIRRTWRYGQRRSVKCHVVAATTEGAVASTVARKMKAWEEGFDAMRGACGRLALDADRCVVRTVGTRVHETPRVSLHLGDSCEVVIRIPDSSVDFTIFSPPFANLYVYSDATQDMGNCADLPEFMAHFEFLIPHLLRVTRPGRLCAVHCKQLLKLKGREGVMGLVDFRGEIIRAFERHGWQYHSEICIWKCPVTEMQRTKAHGLLYKQLRTDSSLSRQGLPDYLVVFRRWDGVDATTVPVMKDTTDFPVERWQRYASPVWMDVNQARVLGPRIASEGKDERHVCPLQLDVIERAVELWSNPGDVVFSPFAGIGSEGVGALKLGRRFVGIELKESYWRQAIRYLTDAEERKGEQFAFDLASAAAPA